MQAPIEYNLDKLIEVLVNLRQKYGKNLDVKMFDYRMEQFTSIDGIEFEEHSGTIYIT